MQREEKVEEDVQKKTGLRPLQFFLQGCIAVCFFLMLFEMPNEVESYLSFGLLGSDFNGA